VFVRWDSQQVDRDRERRLPRLGDDAVVRTFDAPEALDIRFHEVRAKSALNAVPKKSRMPFRWTVNPYRGCSHACSYCFARSTHTYLDLDAGRDFEREIVVKVNVPEVLRAQLAKPSWKREQVALGTNTDPYQWVESRYRLMPEIWQALLDFDTPGSLVTKSPLAVRDIDILQDLAAGPGVTVFFSVPTLDERAWRETEPHTPSPRARLEGVRKMNEAGVPSGILIAPLMPGINDSPEQVREILEIAEDAGAISAPAMPLHLRPGVKEVFFEWMRAHRPDLMPRYEALYNGRSYVPSAERKRIAEMVDGVRPPRRKSRPRGAPAGRRPPRGRHVDPPQPSKPAEPEQPSLF
jgi:DNA repair photolyase